MEKQDREEYLKGRREAYHKYKDRYAQKNKQYRAEHRDYYKQKRKEYLAKRLAWVNNIKQERGCKNCGGKDGLEFHHRDKTTKVANISIMVTNLVKLEVLLAEIEKCDVLCSKCHDSIHIKERTYTEEERIEAEKRAKIKQQEYRDEHKEQINDYHQNYRQENKDKIRARLDDYRRRNPEKIREWDRQYRDRHKEEISERAKIYREKNLDRMKEKNKQDFQNKKEYYYQKRKEYMAALVKWVNDLKQEQGCKVCGTRELIGFYYKNPNETAPNVSKLVNAMKNRNIILDAIKKCDVYCNSCYSKIKISNRSRSRKS